MLKLFSAEYIENTYFLWEFGGSWILNFCKRVLSISSMLVEEQTSPCFREWFATLRVVSS